MTLLGARESGGADGQDPPRLIKSPLWLLSGQAGVIVAIMIGFGVRPSVKPKIVAAMLLCCIGGSIAFGPAHRVNRIILTAPVVAITSWWLASYFWTSNVYGWWTDTQAVIPFVLACVVLVGILPGDVLRRSLVAGCYVAIVYTLAAFVVHGAAAMMNPDGVSGWRGGFIHKNLMGLFMVFAILVLASFDRRGWRRLVGISVAAGLIVMSKSTTALGAGLVALFVCLFLRKLATSPRPARASLVVGALCASMLAGVLGSSVVSALLGASGEDSTLSGRTDVWTGVWHAVTQRPWQGYGAGGVWRNPSVNPGWAIMRDLGFTVYHSHNGFLEVLLLLGVIGLGLWLWLLVDTVRLGLTNLREDPAMAVFAIGFVVLIVVASISEVLVFGIWLAVLCALHCLMVRMDRQRRAPRVDQLQTSPSATGG